MAIDIEPFSLPLSRPLRTATGEIETRSGFVIRTEIDGVPGVGEATPLPGWTETLKQCERALSFVEDPLSALESDQLAAVPAARHGLSLAVLDARARDEGRPLYRYLGCDKRVDSVPVNATVGDCSAAETVSSVESAVESGYSAVKIKVGKRRPATDVERIKAVRGRCPDVELRVDVNGGWNFEVAEEIIPELAALDVTIVEQPLPPSELRGHARLRDRGVEIGIDEGLIEHGSNAVLDAEAADVLMCKPMALGGIDIVKAVERAARMLGTGIIVTTTVDGAIARAAASHLAASIPERRPCGLATGELLERDIVDGICPVIDGTTAVPQGKGNIPPQ